MKKILIILGAALISGCALFQKTTKHRSEEKQELNTQMQINKLAVKTGQKETNVYTYWPDGSVYQWQHSVAQVEEARFGTVQVDEQATTKTEGTTIQRAPSSTTLFILILAGVLIVLLIIYRL